MVLSPIPYGLPFPQNGGLPPLNYKILIYHQTVRDSATITMDSVYETTTGLANGTIADALRPYHSLKMRGCALTKKRNFKLPPNARVFFALAKNFLFIVGENRLHCNDFVSSFRVYLHGN